MGMNATPLPEEQFPLPDFVPRSLSAIAREQLLPRGTTLFRAGQRPIRVFYITLGEVHLVRHGMHGQTVVFQRSGPGRFLAEPSIDSPHYHCDAVAVRASRLRAFPLAEFRKTLDVDPEFARRWRLFLAQEVRRLRAQAERLAMRTVRDRIIHYIECEGSGGSLRWPGDLKLLATELAVTHEALYRELAALVRDRLLVRAPGMLQLVTPGGS